MTGPDRTPIAVANTAFSECMGQVSPDGRWVVYQTDESGRSEIMVQAFPRPNGRFAVSTHGGSAPRWNAAGDEIYFIAPDRKMMAVPVRIAGSTLQSATPVALFSTQAMDHPFKIPYAVARDGRFLINSVVAEASAPPISLILNAKP